MSNTSWIAFDLHVFPIAVAHLARRSCAVYSVNKLEPRAIWIARGFLSLNGCAGAFGAGAAEWLNAPVR